MCTNGMDTVDHQIHLDCARLCVKMVALFKLHITVKVNFSGPPSENTVRLLVGYHKDQF